MPAPALFVKGHHDPFAKTALDEKSPQSQIYYATERVRSKDGRFYSAKRDSVLHLGKATVGFGPGKITREQIARRSLKKKPGLTVPVDDILEFEDLETTSAPLPGEKQKTRMRNDLFARDINERLKKTGLKDVYIFVSGFRVPFEDPILVAQQFWHYFGYEGVFFAYCWPATPASLVVYGHDIETTNYCSRNFRLLLEFLAQNTEVRQIHIIAHSAGTRVVSTALHELRLKNSHINEEQMAKTLKIGHVVLIGADYDRMLARAYYRDGILDLLQNLTLYVSKKDLVLKFAGALFQTPRLGHHQLKDIAAESLRVIKENPKINFIDASPARGVVKEWGHMYVLTSPWISSDMILALKYGLAPAERHLQSVGNGLYWEFGKDYDKKISTRI